MLNQPNCYAMNKFLKTMAFTALSSLFLACAPKPHEIQIAAHRGFWNCEEAGFAQNSIAALRLAQEHEFWGSEFDVQMTADSVPLVNHNNEFHGLSIWDNPYEAFKDSTLVNGEPIPTLDDYLIQGLKSNKTILVMELKAQKNEEMENVMTDKALEALKTHDLYDPARVMFISFSFNICKRIAEKAPEFTNQYLGSDRSPEELAKDGINGVDYQFKTFAKNPDWIEHARANKMSVNCWTVNKEEDIQAMIDLEVDCITTDEPLLVRELLGSREGKL